MRISNIILNTKGLFTMQALALLIGVGIFATAISAQKEAPLANPDLDQCANGPSTAAKLPCTGNNWQNGNLNGNNSQYVEGESVSYRVIFTGTPNTAGSLLIEYDTTKNGKRAIDYLTTYDRSNPTGNAPCDNGAQPDHCDPLVFTTIAIPTDTDVTNGPNGLPGGGDDITQVPGVFTLFGGTITGVSTYGLSGVYTGDSTRSITVNFDFDANGKVVLAWSGHISRRIDWGIGATAIAISGSPYHTVVNNGSNVSMQVEAVIVPGSVRIVKLVRNADNTYDSVFSFGFTASANYGTTAFSLIDNDPAEFGGASNTNSNIQLFGAANTITISENTPPSNYGLISLACVEDPGGLPQSDNSTTNLGTRTASIIVEEGEFVTCTFTNSQLGPTAARVSVGGRVITSNGAGIMRARVIMTDQDGNVRTAISNSFGYYRFDEVEVGQSYVFNVVSKEYEFSPRVVSLEDAIGDLDFIAF